MMLAGVYEGVMIRPNSPADALLRLYRSYGEQADIMRTVLLMVASLKDVDTSKLTDMYGKYLSMAYPPAESQRAQSTEAMQEIVGKHWDAIQEQVYKDFERTPKG